MRPQPGVELRHTGLRPIIATEPYRPLADHVTDHNAIGVALTDRDLVNADCRRSGTAGTRDLSQHVQHVLHLQCLDGVPGEFQFLGNVTDRSLSATTPNIERKALGEVRIVRQEIPSLALHRPAVAARHATHFKFKDDAKPGARKVANPPIGPVIPARLHPTAAAAGGFFERRSSVTIRISRSPNTPRTDARAETPKRISIRQPPLSLARLRHASSCRIPSRFQDPKRQCPCMLPVL